MKSYLRNFYVCCTYSTYLSSWLLPLSLPLVDPAESSESPISISSANRGPATCPWHIFRSLESSLQYVTCTIPSRGSPPRRPHVSVLYPSCRRLYATRCSNGGSSTVGLLHFLFHEALIYLQAMGLLSALPSVPYPFARPLAPHAIRRTSSPSPADRMG